MEMHTVESLRRVHGIDVRHDPRSAQVSRLTYANFRTLADRARYVEFVAAMRQLASWFRKGGAQD